MSPALFAIALEPLAAMITSHDILLYLHDPLNSMPFTLYLFEKFGKLSGYKGNWDKTEIMPILNFDHTLLRNNLNWKWSTKCIKHLGMFIPRKLEDTFNLNYLP